MTEGADAIQARARFLKTLRQGYPLSLEVVSDLELDVLREALELWVDEEVDMAADARLVEAADYETKGNAYLRIAAAEQLRKRVSHLLSFRDARRKAEAAHPNGEHACCEELRKIRSSTTKGY